MWPHSIPDVATDPLPRLSLLSALPIRATQEDPQQGQALAETE